jgi:tetratricopeptide (TPR) repeat protein
LTITPVHEQALFLIFFVARQHCHEFKRLTGYLAAREAEQVLVRFLAERDKRYVSAAAIGIIYAALGNMDEALRWLERAYNDHDAVLTTIAFYPGSQPLRDDPRFIDLIKRVGLDPAKAIPRRN